MNQRGTSVHISAQFVLFNLPILKCVLGLNRMLKADRLHQILCGFDVGTPLLV